jgi:hypothetical protein
MQIFVSKTALAGTDPVPVIATYDDLPVRKIDLHGMGATVLTLPLAAVVPPPKPSGTVPAPPLPTLKPSFRGDYMPMMVNGEASRRITLVFPDYMQRNANNDASESILKYGNDSSTWPQDAQDRRAQGDQGWAYVNACRQTSDALATDVTIVDPTDDSHWPTSPPPIYIPPVP